MIIIKNIIKLKHIKINIPSFTVNGIMYSLLVKAKKNN